MDNDEKNRQRADWWASQVTHFTRRFMTTPNQSTEKALHQIVKDYREAVESGRFKPSRYSLEPDRQPH